MKKIKTKKKAEKLKELRREARELMAVNAKNRDRISGLIRQALKLVKP